MKLRKLLSIHKMECNNGTFKHYIEIIKNNSECIRIAYDDFNDCFKFLREEILDTKIDETGIFEFNYNEYQEIVYRIFLK